MTLKCPYCKIDDHHIIFSLKKGDIFFCLYCGERGIVVNNCKVRRITEKEKLSETLSEKALDSPAWIPRLNKKDISFRVVIIENRVFNPSMYEDYSFLETERYLKLFFNITGQIPQVDDCIWAERKPEKGKNKVPTKEEFYIVGRGFGIDSYDEIMLLVIPAERWLELKRY